MTDGELRGVVLQSFYDARHKGQMTSVPIDASRGLDATTSNNVAQHLKQLGLIELFSPVSGPGSGRITAKGVDVVEGRAPASAFGVTVVDNRIAVSGSSNTLHVTNSQNVTNKTSAATGHSAVSETPSSTKTSWLARLLSQIPGVGKILDKLFKSGA